MVVTKHHVSSLFRGSQKLLFGTTNVCDTILRQDRLNNLCPDMRCGLYFVFQADSCVKCCHCQHTPNSLRCLCAPDCCKHHPDQRGSHHPDQHGSTHQCRVHFPLSQCSIRSSVHRKNNLGLLRLMLSCLLCVRSGPLQQTPKLSALRRLTHLRPPLPSALALT